MFLIAILVAAILAFACYKIFIETKTDDIGEEIKKIEKKDNKKARKSGNIVICKLCGEKINTLKYDFCPSCGGRFYVDEKPKLPQNYNYPQSTSATTPKTTYVRTTPTRNIAPLNNTQPQSGNTVSKNGKKASPAVIAVIVFIVIGTIMTAIVSANFDDKDFYDYTDDITEYFYGVTDIPDYYEEQDYTLEGSDILFEEDGVSVSIEKFYQDTSGSDFIGEPLVHFAFTNESENDVAVFFDIVAVNNDCSLYKQTTIDAKADSGETVDVLRYIDADTSLSIKTLAISHIKISDQDTGEVYYGETEEEYDKLIYVTTTTDEEITSSYDFDEKPIYDKNGVRIFISESSIYLENNSDNDFTVDAYAFTKNTKLEEILEGNILLLHGCNVTLDYNTDYDDSYGSFSFNFECKADPSADFKTGKVN